MVHEKVVVELDNFEQRLMVSGLADFRNDLIREDKPTEDVDDLILQVIDAPTKREKRRGCREAREVLQAKHHSVCFWCIHSCVACSVDCALYG